MLTGVYFESRNKMAIDSKFSEAEIQSIFVANNMKIDLKFFPWKTKLETTNDFDEVLTILESRMVEIRDLYGLVNQDEKSELEQEWVSLVVYKDRNLRLKIQEENEAIKNKHIAQLYDTLKALGTFTFPNQKDAILRRNMAKMFRQVEKYCTRNNIDTKSESTDTANQQSVNQLLLPNAPPPPPQPVSKTKFQPQPMTPQILRKAIVNDSKPLKEQNAPLDSFSNELLRSIKRGRALELKRTPCKRSPGGTPLKRPRRLSESDTSDLITLALQRKFRNVKTISSPNENLSPNIISTGSPS